MTEYDPNNTNTNLYIPQQQEVQRQIAKKSRKSRIDPKKGRRVSVGPFSIGINVLNRFQDRCDELGLNENGELEDLMIKWLEEHDRDNEIEELRKEKYIIDYKLAQLEKMKAVDEEKKAENKARIKENAVDLIDKQFLLQFEDTAKPLTLPDKKWIVSKVNKVTDVFGLDFLTVLTLFEERIKAKVSNSDIRDTLMAHINDMKPKPLT